jgi:hypothetical protein
VRFPQAKIFRRGFTTLYRFDREETLWERILQRNFTQLIEPRSWALTMGDIGRVVPLLPGGDDVQHGWGVELTPGQDAAQQHLHLGDGHAWGCFFA